MLFKLLPLLILLLPVSALEAAESGTRGKLSGGIVHEVPDWFKESFLEIAEDVDEATEAGKQLMLFFHLDECPYCDRMLNENFIANPPGDYIRQHFDVIAINVKGDREIVYNEEITVTEKQLSEVLQVTATPAILFLDESNRTALRVNGYRAPERFRHILEFAVTRAYRTTSLPDYLQARLDRNVYQLRDDPMFSDITDLSGVDGPLALIFEDGGCYDCAEFHDTILAHPEVRKELEPFTVVRLDADSDAPIIDPAGQPTTPAALAREYEMVYRPGVLAFDDGLLVRRHDSLNYPHHFKESLRYVAGGFYKQTDYRSYSDRRTEELLEAGVDIYLGRPKAD